jgi:hypothetical protein
MSESTDRFYGRSESNGRSYIIPVSDRGALHRLRRLRGVELPVTLFAAASALVPGNDNADMVRPSPLACSGDFLLRLAGRQGKHLIAEGRRGALAASWCCGRSAIGLLFSLSRLIGLAGLAETGETGTESIWCRLHRTAMPPSCDSVRQRKHGHRRGPFSGALPG